MNATIEDALKVDYPDHDVITTARGTVALYLALRSVARTRGVGEVIVPATVCPSVPATVLLSGFVPRFCDVDLSTFCMSEKTVSACLGPRTRAIIAVHLFGKAVDLSSIAGLASSCGAALVEDVAQGPGGRVQGRRLGSVGDFSMFSFNRTKVITGAGGALLVRDGSLRESILADLQGLPERLDDARFEELSVSFRNLTHGLYDLLRNQGFESSFPVLQTLAEAYRPLFVHRHDDRTGLDLALESYRTLPEELALRRRNCELLVARLPGGFAPVLFQDEEMCWRLPLLVGSHDAQLASARRLRGARHLVSNHYFPASLLFGERSCAAAHQIGLRALNLWVDSSIDLERISDVCSLLAGDS